VLGGPYGGYWLGGAVYLKKVIIEPLHTFFYFVKFTINYNEKRFWKVFLFLILMGVNLL